MREGYDWKSGFDLEHKLGTKSGSMAAALAVLEDKQEPGKTVTGIFSSMSFFDQVDHEVVDARKEADTRRSR